MIFSVYTTDFGIGGEWTHGQEQSGVGPVYTLWQSAYRRHKFHDGRSQWDQPCPKCLKIARVGIHYAPDMHRNWWVCPSCGYEWV